ncbi:MAG: sterol desaturase family protein, partial [Pseudomonadota bacterium]|nr:sterol desaturase family protein [Pseudomonadota bacterium]
LLLVTAQRSQVLQGYEAYAWGMMLWLGVSNAALLSNHDSAWFRVQDVLKLLVLCTLAAQLSEATALVVIPLALMAAVWPWVEREAEVASATSVETS